jgi:hypothetical protein
MELKMQDKQTKFFSILCLALMLSGCATQGKSAGLGGLIGATGGAAIGGIAHPGKKGQYRTRNVVVGAAVGGIAGLVAGSSLFDTIKSREAKAYSKGRASVPGQPAGTMPALTEAKVESRWIEGRVVGNRYIEGHFEYIIIEPTRWNPR